MAGINRLGKGPPRPGMIRPPDPNRNRTIDIKPEGADSDADFVRLTRDIEEMQQRQGWLFGRGAFDKSDLLYLRDHAEQQRHKEEELRTMELMQFAKMRSMIDEQLDAKQAPTKAPEVALKPKKELKPTSKLLPAVRVAKASEKHAAPSSGLSHGCKPADKPLEPAAKRPKLSGDLQDSGQLSYKPSTEARVHREAGSSTPQARPATSSEEPEGGLLGLLGDYGDSDEDGTGTLAQAAEPSTSKAQPVSPASHNHSTPSKLPEPQQQQQHQGKTTASTAPALPSAAELLGLDAMGKVANDVKPEGEVAVGPPVEAAAVEQHDDADTNHDSDAENSTSSSSSDSGS